MQFNLVIFFNLELFVENIKLQFSLLFLFLKNTEYIHI